MDKAKAKNSIKILNQLATLVTKRTEQYIDETIENADMDELVCIVGAQATYLNTIAKAVVCNVKNMKDGHIEDYKSLIETTDNIMADVIETLGVEGIEPEDEPEEISDDEYLDIFSKEAGLTDAEKKVLAKIVKAKGHPTDMTEEERKIAIKMAPKMNSIFD